jgi:hypothetical protein
LLLAKVNEEGEYKISYYKKKNNNLRRQILSLQLALEVSRSSVLHFEEVSSFWSSMSMSSSQTNTEFTPICSKPASFSGGEAEEQERGNQNWQQLQGTTTTCLTLAAKKSDPHHSEPENYCGGIRGGSRSS